MIDMGGGSTKIVDGIGNTPKTQQDFSMGAVIAKEQFQVGDVISSTTLTIRQTTLQRVFNPLPIVAANSRMEAGHADIILPVLIIRLIRLERLTIHTFQITVRGARYGILL